MRALPLAWLFLSIPAFAAPTGAKLLDCNLGFGPIAQVVVREDSAGLSYTALTATGRWLPAQSLDAADWRQHKISFVYKSERIELSAPKGEWWYKVSYEDDGTTNVFGAADCE